MRIGVVGLLHESNTFVSQATGVEEFRRGALLTGDSITDAFADAHHELGGFLERLQAEPDVEPAPLFVARATPSGVIHDAAFDYLVDEMLDLVRRQGPFDGLLAAPHGATVSESYPDADGEWLTRLRHLVGGAPIVATLDAHANLSPAMVRACNAIVAYRTNPHLDQRARGVEAADLLLAHLRGECRLRMAAALPPLAINIERQCTAEPQFDRLRQLAEQQRRTGAVLSNSLLLGFPYADVEEMGSAVLAVASNHHAAAEAARELATVLWEDREQFDAQLLSVDDALMRCQREATLDERFCLLDMGDNVGGGSAGDGTHLLGGLVEQCVEGAVVCLFDPAAVAECRAGGEGAMLTLSVGGKTDRLHGESVSISGRVAGFHDGRFRELAARHGGIVQFDQGSTAVFHGDCGVTLVLNSRRTAPFSLEQLRSCGVDVQRHRIFVAKGVNAPIAAYQEICGTFLRVNTPGSTCADMRQLTYHRRRRPLFPLESEVSWSAGSDDVVFGFGSDPNHE